METKTKRIEWCDIYKGIMITLVVIGHATGAFNSYIYQFHMAAFFFISGYTSRLREDTNTTFIEQLFKKAYRLLVPYFAIELIGLMFFCVFQKVGILNSISTVQYPAGIWAALSEFFHFRMYCDWLGAMWFLPVLFLASVFVDFLARICKKDSILLLVSLLLSACSIAYLLFSRGELSGSLYLAGIAQWFITMGYVTKKVRKESVNSMFIFVKCIIIALIWQMARKYGGMLQVVDWPSYSFNGLIDLFIPLMGILFTIYLSEMIEKSRYIKRLLIILGKNSIGIMCLHFIGFKVAYLILILFGKMKASSFKQLTPVLEIQNYWFFITGIAIAFSVIIWRLCQRVYILRVLFGGASIKAFIDKINLHCGDLEESITNCYYFLLDILKTFICRIKEIRKIAFLLCMLIVLCLSVKQVRSIAMNSGLISVTFPYYSNNISFNEGWLEQAENENYRWVDKHSECTLWLHNQKKLHIEGYVPENVQNMNIIKIVLNDTVVLESELKNGQQILYDIDISACVKKYSINRLQIEFDGTRIPGEEEQDKRIFSALINAIAIQ